LQLLTRLTPRLWCTRIALPVNVIPQYYTT